VQRLPYPCFIIKPACNCNPMSKLEEIQQAIQELSPEDFSNLTRWLAELDWQKWDEQIEKDSESGKLDFWVEKASRAKANNQLSEL
jgi:hypothetical protein